MTARSRIAAPASVDEVTVAVYHACANFATGAALGPSDAVSYWWLEPSGRARVVSSADLLQRDAIQKAIRRVVGSLAPDVARAAQDARAEAPDL